MARYNNHSGHHHDDYNHDGGPDISSRRANANRTLGGVITVSAGPDDGRLL